MLEMEECLDREQKIVKPVLKSFRDNPNVELTGPFPADAFFGRKQFEKLMVLAAYHYQGLAPFKLWSMGKG